MKSYFGSYYSSHGTEPVDSTVLVFDKNLNIGFRNPDGSNAMISWLLKDVEVSFDLPSQQTRLRNNGSAGPELWIPGNEAAVFIKEMQAERGKPWHKKSSGKEWIRNSLLIIGILGALFLAYLLIVPWLSQQLASKVSIKTEKQLGDAVYDAMSLPAQEDSAKTILLNEFFRKLNVATPYDIRISLVNDNTVNAFALPGGRIVVFSGLLKEMTSYPELAAVLSHEFTHVNNKHSTKRIFRQLGSKVFLGLLFGRFGTVTNVLVNHADNLKSLHYSRRLEKEADMEGLKVLSSRGVDPKGFSNLFHHLQEATPSSALPEFLTSHPDVDKRIAYISEAAKGVVVKEDAELKAIFEKLK
ncbi:MAG TPA: M48 family metallopeptidase [Chitinophagaceae bacterium]|jgi:Zn-dependent protease with chaperone function|nr:M48 family metallopeptidase [Chitinophagaceae bacterium]